MEYDKIFLVGLPGSGKTTLGKQLASELGLPFVDLDEEIINTTNQSIPSIFENKGEDAFRKIERAQLEKLISTYPKFVLATGGGTPCFFDSMELMNKNGLTVFLETPIEEIEKRLEGDSSRPLLKKHNLIELLENRKSCYYQAQRSISDFTDLRKILV